MNNKELSKKKNIISRISFGICMISLTLLLQLEYRRGVYVQYIDDFKNNFEIHISIDVPESLEAKHDYEIFRANDTAFVNKNLKVLSKCLEELPKGIIEDIGSAAYVTDINDGYFYSSNPLDAIEGAETPFVSGNDIHIILCNELYNKEKENISGCFFHEEESYYIVLTLKEEGKIAESFYHELFHAIEERSAYTKYMMSYTAFVEWDKYNPKDYDYFSSDSKGHILGMSQSKEDVYFVSEYATKGEGEDKAELFEHLMIIDSKEEFEKLMQYPHIKEKAQYMSDVLIDVFPSITKENCFQWQKWLMEMEE